MVANLQVLTFAIAGKEDVVLAHGLSLCRVVFQQLTACVLSHTQQICQPRLPRPDWGIESAPVHVLPTQAFPGVSIASLTEHST